jgi:hypothetical protein
MAVTLPRDVLEDNVATTIATITAAANRRARELGIDVLGSRISISEQTTAGATVWRVNYGPREYVNHRGGDVIIEVDPTDGKVVQVLRGQ